MTIQRREFVAAVGTTGVAALAGCTALGDGNDDGEPEIHGDTLTLTTTTSTYDTGLLDELNAPFEDHYGVSVDTVAQGTGAALETARNGDCDVVIVHARTLEDEFLEDGYGVNRRDLMVNDFVVVGDPDDPASIGGSEDALEAFRTIASEGATFVSRGDDSGTHTRERGIWEEAGLAVEDFDDWYVDGGGGMGEILFLANQQGGYTLADRGTYLSMRADLDLEVHVEGPIGGGSDRLANTYGIVVVNPAVHEGVAYDLAMAYVGYVTGPEGQGIIEGYTVDGEPLFIPAALSEEPNFEQHVPEGWESDED